MARPKKRKAGRPQGNFNKRSLFSQALRSVKKMGSRSKKNSSPPKKTKATQPDLQKPITSTSGMPKRRVYVAPAPEVPPREKIKYEPPVPETISYQWTEPQQEDYLSKDLPSDYGDNHIYLLVRDPYWIYSYWEIQQSRYEEGLAQLRAGWDDVKTVLRIYDITEEDGKQTGFSDVYPQPFSNNWYFEVQPNRSYVVEIGLIHRNGRFVALARSNAVVTPRDSMSDVLDEEWIGIDFDKMYALSGGFEIGKSSMELKQLMQERLEGAISSGSGGGILSGVTSPVKVKKRGFYFWLDCELVLYGGTEPDAKVFFQGKEMKLRPDGTFSLRFALPDGKQELETRAISADGIEERTITPHVTRRTRRPAPVLKSGAGK